MSFCKQCGNELKSGANFCPKCGTPCNNASKPADSNAGGQKKPSNASSDAHYWVILVIAIIAFGGFVGYAMYQSEQTIKKQREEAARDERLMNLMRAKVTNIDNTNRTKEPQKRGRNASSASYQNYTSSVGSSSPQPRQRPFTDGQDIMARIYNQRFIHSSGLEIRIDGYGRIDIDGDPAGILSVLQYNSKSALLRYGNGLYGEGKILLQIAGNKLLLKDPIDGSVFYQR